MALGALTLSTTTGVQGRPFRAAILGLTTGRVEVLTDGSPGFSTVNGRVDNAALPYAVSTVVLREYDPTYPSGYRDSRIDIQASGAPVASQASDGTITYTVPGAGGGLSLSPTTIDQAATGAVSQLSATLPGPVSYSKVSGSGVGVSAAGAVSVTTALGSGTLAFVARAQNASGDAVEKAFTLTGGAAVAPPPPPTPQLTATPSAPSISAGAAAGTLVFAIGGVPAGATPTATPNDGRFVIAGDAASGWRVVTGMSALSAGSVAVGVAAAGATGVTVGVAVTAVTSTPIPTPQPLPAFSYDPDAAAIHSAYAAKGVTLTSGMKYSIHAMVSRLKLKGVWQAMKNVTGWTPGLWFFQPESTTSGEETINWLSPGAGDLIKRGNPTLTVRGQVLFPTISDYYETTILPQSIDIANFQMSAWVQTASDVNATDMGSIEGSTTGIQLVCRQDAGVSVRLKSASVLGLGAGKVGSIGSSYVSVGCNSTTSGSIRGYGVEKAVATVTPAALTANAPMLIGHANGAGTTSPRGFRHAGMYGYLTPAQDRELSAAVDDFTNSVALGHLEVSPPGYAPAAVNADVVVYGWTSGGMCAAYQAAKLGRTVAWVGGMLDHRGSIGGMSTSGLGAIDTTIKTNAAVGGLPRALMAKVNTIAGATNSIQTFEPRLFYGAMKAFLDPTRADGVAGITLYSSYGYGVTAISRTGAQITSMSTGDGRVFIGKQYIDASEEDDLAFIAGCTTAIGREAATTGAEGVLGGYRGTLTTSRSGEHQFGAGGNDPTKTVKVNPFVDGATQASGLLPGLVYETETVGQADGLVQAYNVRMPFQSSDHRKLPMPTAFPSGFSAANYELLFREHAAATAAGYTMQIGDALLLRECAAANNGGVFYDANNSGGFSTDMIGEQMNYIAAAQSFSGRLASSQKIWAYTKGFLYAASGYADSRVQSGYRTALNGYGLDARANPVPSPDQEVGQPPRIYVREHRRLVGDFIMNADDIAATDGTTPRSIKTIGVASYNMDRHHVQRLAITSGSTPYVWNEGNVQDSTSGGADRLSPIPMEAILPKAAEATNLSVLFGISGTSLAMSCTRMEFPFMQLGMSAAFMAHQAITNNQALKDVDYPTLRTAILGAGYAVQSPLPQTN